ncbi:hypothetical protein DC522_08300 [Microvirga sp. KLBC 81]|nr:hypothetical protein DC522_08300 [Microvirga sp. KLBC 81]
MLEGCVRLEAQAHSIPCRIRDLSATGARIGLAADVELPGEFELNIPRLQLSLKVRLVWSRAKSHGVMFLEDLGQTSNGDVMSFLNALAAPDDGNYSDAVSERSTPPFKGAREKQLPLLSRKSG